MLYYITRYSSRSTDHPSRWQKAVAIGDGRFQSHDFLKTLFGRNERFTRFGRLVYVLRREMIASDGALDRESLGGRTVAVIGLQEILCHLVPPPIKSG